MNKSWGLFIGLLFSKLCLAQIPLGYYNSVSTQTGASLKTTLFNIIKNPSVTSYSGLFSAYETTDAKQNGKVWDMYSDIPNGTPTYEYSFSQKCGNYNEEGDCFNREHSFPQSWFNSNSPMQSDLFHVYPTDGKVNGIRSNWPFGEVGNTTQVSTNGSKLGTSSFTGYSGTVFEPINEYKGDFARTYFYMATCYENLIGNWVSNGNAGSVLSGNSFPAYDQWYLNLLAKWHQQDPVSTKELDRNNAVYAIQGNRNPFIDHPEYAGTIWGFTTTSPVITVPSTINQAPLATNITLSGFNNQTFTGSLINYVSDANNEPLSFLDIDNQSIDAGIFDLSSDGNYSFISANTFTGKSTITYSICDAVTCTSALIVINLSSTGNHLNTTPGVNTLPGVSTTSGIPLTPQVQNFTFSGLKNSIINGNISVIQTISGMVSYQSTHTSLGTFLLNTNGSFSYFPPNNFVGSDIYVYKICINSTICGTAQISFQITSLGNNLPPTSVENQLISRNNWSVYPNPAQSFIYIENSEYYSIQLELWNVYSQKIGVYLLENGINTLSMVGFPKGMYFVKIKNQTIKLIIE